MPRKARRPDPPSIGTGQPYGQAGPLNAQAASIPAPASGGGGAVPARGGADPAATLSAATDFVPPPLTPLDAPSERGGEPVTAGLPVGAGEGPEALGMPMGQDSDLELIRAAYRQYPSEALRQMIEDLEDDA